MTTPPTGGPSPSPASSELTQAIEIFLASGFTPRQILQLAGLCAEAHAMDYGEVVTVFQDRRLKRFQKLEGIPPVK